MSDDVHVRVCDDSDLDALAFLNKQLIEDENHDNTMGIDQLKARMQAFIHSGYVAYLFENNGEIIGYALADHGRNPIYLRQFFICRNVRRRGFGRRAFRELTGLLRSNTLEVEVLSWNEAGIGFWKSLGFEERSICLRYHDGTDCQ